eukprot:1817878-Rhodomonas_salina.1
MCQRQRTIVTLNCDFHGPGPVGTISGYPGYPGTRGTRVPGPGILVGIPTTMFDSLPCLRHMELGFKRETAETV